MLLGVGNVLRTRLRLHLKRTQVAATNETATHGGEVLRRPLLLVTNGSTSLHYCPVQIMLPYVR